MLKCIAKKGNLRYIIINAINRGDLMIDSANFIVRSSGQKPGFYYIDYLGQYKIAEISKEVKIEASKITEIFIVNGGDFDSDVGVYYFSDFLMAKNTISEIVSKVKIVNKGRNISFTEAEIAQIRKALISDSNYLGVESKIKDKILKKLNG